MYCKLIKSKIISLEMVFYSLPMGKINKKTKVKKLNNLPSNFETDFSKNWLENVHSSSLSSDFWRKIISEAPSQDVKDYLLATSEYEKQIQEDIDPYITRDRLKEASFRRKLDRIAKDVIRKQNPIELVFKDISTFDAQNLVIGALLKEIDIGKKDIFSKIISKVPSIVDLDIKSRLQQLRDYNNNLGNKNYNNNFPLSLQNCLQDSNQNRQHQRLFYLTNLL